MAKDNQTVALTKRLLKDGLIRILENKPINKVSVTELCMESGINRATFYRHYTVAHDILAEIEQDITSEIKAMSELSKI